MSNTSKSRKVSRGSDSLRRSMAELKGYADRGMTMDDIVDHYQKHHPDRIRTYTKTDEGKWVRSNPIRTDPSIKIGQPGKYTPAALKKLRVKLALSQAVFAESIGVSTVLVQSWERGVRAPSPMARRLLDVVSKNPKDWLASLVPLTPVSASPVPAARVLSRRAG